MKGAPDEEMEAEAVTGVEGDIADFSLTLRHFPVGRDAWSYSGQTITGTDGKSSVTLISGRSLDVRGALQSIHIRSLHSMNRWLSIARDPLKKAEAIREIEAALAAAGGK